MLLVVPAFLRIHRWRMVRLPAIHPCCISVVLSVSPRTGTEPTAGLHVQRIRIPEFITGTWPCPRGIAFLSSIVCSMILLRSIKAPSPDYWSSQWLYVDETPPAAAHVVCCVCVRLGRFWGLAVNTTVSYHGLPAAPGRWRGSPTRWFTYIWYCTNLHPSIHALLSCKQHLRSAFHGGSRRRQRFHLVVLVC